MPRSASPSAACRVRAACGGRAGWLATIHLGQAARSRCPHSPYPPATESLSLSHAVSIVLSRLFEARQAAGGYAVPQGLTDLAPGFEETGVER